MLFFFTLFGGSAPVVEESVSLVFTRSSLSRAVMCGGGKGRGLEEGSTQVIMTPPASILTAVAYLLLQHNCR